MQTAKNCLQCHRSISNSEKSYTLTITSDNHSCFITPLNYFHYHCLPSILQPSTFIPITCDCNTTTTKPISDLSTIVYPIIHGPHSVIITKKCPRKGAEEESS